MGEFTKNGLCLLIAPFFVTTCTVICTALMILHRKRAYKVLKLSAICPFSESDCSYSCGKSINVSFAPTTQQAEQWQREKEKLYLQIISVSVKLKLDIPFRNVRS